MKFEGTAVRLWYRWQLAFKLLQSCVSLYEAYERPSEWDM